jgi:hypothetical protein
MADETPYPGAAPDDVPPAPSPGGTVADEYVRRAARGRSAGSGKERASRSSASGAPTPTEDDDLSRPLTTAEKSLREAILELYTGAQMLASMTDPPTAEILRVQKGACADAWVILGRRDKRVKALLVKLTTGSAWGAVFMAHMPIVLPLLMRKGILPGGALFGGAPFNMMPDVPGDGGSVTDDWPYDSALFDGTVPFSGNGDGGAS